MFTKSQKQFSLMVLITLTSKLHLFPLNEFVGCTQLNGQLWLSDDIWTHLLAHWCITVRIYFQCEVDWVYRSWTYLLVDEWNDLESALCTDALYVQVNGLIDWSGNTSVEQLGKYVCDLVVYFQPCLFCGNFRRPNNCLYIVHFSRLLPKIM